MNTPAKKSLGQHWLRDNEILDKIVIDALVHQHDTVLEVGPGHGSLTKKLLQTGAQVVAVELDDILVEKLKSEIDSPHFTIIHDDILRFDLTKLPPGYKVVANIPYYLTSKLIRVLSESDSPPKAISLLVQKEVARRVAARPGEMSLLSVSAQYYYEVALGVEVSAGYFTPPPKVDSQVVNMTRLLDHACPSVGTKDFFRVVRAGFSNRRKTLVNSLSGSLAISKIETELAITAAGLKPLVRAQELSLDEWCRLARRLTS